MDSLTVIMIVRFDNKIMQRYDCSKVIVMSYHIPAKTFFAFAFFVHIFINSVTKYVICSFYCKKSVDFSNIFFVVVTDCLSFFCPLICQLSVGQLFKYSWFKLKGRHSVTVGIKLQEAYRNQVKMDQMLGLCHKSVLNVTIFI